MFIENIFASKAKVKILRVLAETRTAFTLQELKNETELSIGIIHKSLQDLVQDKIVLKIKGKKKERLFKFNTENNFAHYIWELFRIEKTRERKEAVLLHTWNVLESIVSKLKDKSELILLFGSQARGEATLRSDIDILILTNKSSKLIIHLLDGVKSKNKINPTILSLSAFQNEIKEETLFYRNLKIDSYILYLDINISTEIKQFLGDIY